MRALSLYEQIGATVLVLNTDFLTWSQVWHKIILTETDLIIWTHYLSVKSRHEKQNDLFKDIHLNALFDCELTNEL